ncbi:MAG: substrate-binding domain-containing protein [Synergistaceae bacterium]|jgi:ribose transport system substrate-binding protein|nr:substrate-binding domain-containing protein [Synergistaceae bacterium]
MKRFFCIVLAMVGALSSVACAATDKPEQISIGVSLMNQTQQFHVTMKDGMQAKADELGVKIVFLDGNMDATKQVTDIEDLITMDVDAIICSPYDRDAVTVPLQKAKDAGIFVITADTGANGVDVDAHIASDNVQGGFIGGKSLFELLGGNGNVVDLNYPYNTTGLDRDAGFMRALLEYPNIKLVVQQTGDAVRDKSMIVMENLLQAYPDINGVFCVNDDTALGAMAAIEAAGKTNIIIVGYDATEEAQAIIKAGDKPLKADVIQYPELIGATAVESALKLTKGEAVEKNVPVEVGIFDGK